MGCVGDLAADVTISVRMEAAHVLCVTAQHARALGDADMSLRTEGLRREAFSTTLQPDPSMSTSARPEEVWSFHGTLASSALLDVRHKQSTSPPQSALLDFGGGSSAPALVLCRGYL